MAESTYDVYEDRLESFTNWPHGTYLLPQIMAAAGFWHSNWDSDEVTCFNCNVGIDSWAQGQDPFKYHFSLSPTCSFINKSYMTSLEERLGSFHQWPIGLKPAPISMAAAGFFHSDKRTDAVTCFSCTLILEDWKQGDDPIAKHLEAVSQEGCQCLWLDKIVGTPERVVGMVQKRAAPMWDHRQKAKKCGTCQKVFSSGNQFYRHRRAMHSVTQSRRITRAKKPRYKSPINIIAARAIERRPDDNVLRGGNFLGRHRVTKPRMPVRRVKRERVGH